MHYWKLFWMVFLLIAGTSFAFITAVVTVKGFGDLLRMFTNLSRQKDESQRHQN